MIERARPRLARLAPGILVVLLGVAAVAWALHPVCVPLSPEDLPSFDGPLEDRQDTDFHVRVFQRREGRWMQCKTWISRRLFF